ncbi:general substrate transporter [Metschnikowia bicuspidata var. bicuspidata NRRL YB-4993]|uniref:General substrate transporter n=1 Tax=Metschnikowia bicuspidata var. bicuspidata NRRL YB-4993 TaxID=869754 RepID=A0A1A0HCS5_9ASCO|nr:general substrate transporter [Metschnikowia bicuspidata var. bicuspidata NRRL YB-4993]OBA21718.1 general substrate transporter [Metschnikowia bicuspidata var. bicuspidata NRRL YB-4993]
MTLSKSTSTSQTSDQDLSIPSFLGTRGTALGRLITIICGVGFLLFGYDQGVMGSLLTLKPFNETYTQIDTTLHKDAATLQGAVIAIYEIGCLLGALSTIYFGDALGRLKVIFIGSIIMIVGGALQAGSTDVAFLAVSRVISGVGNGFLTSTVPLYAAECSKALSRGKTLCIQGCLITFGICVSYWIDFAFYFTEDLGEISFRFPIAFQCVFPIIIIFFIFRLPESPRWLMAKHRDDEARTVFAALYDLPRDHSLVSQQMEEIKISLSMEKSTSHSAWLMLKQGRLRHFQRVNLAGWAQVMQQICGINLITYYAGTIYESYIGLSPFNARIVAACNGTEYFLASLIPIFIIEKVGRRPLFIWGAVGQFLTMLFLYVSMEMSEQGHDGGSYGAAVLLFVFNSIFAVSYLSLTWLYPPEISSLEVRAPTTAVSTACNWSFNFMVVMITPVCFSNIRHYTYLIFAAINFLMVPVVFLLYPETKGRTLEEMDMIFAKTPVDKPWMSVRIAKEMPFAHKDDSEDFEQYKASIMHEEIVEGSLFASETPPKSYY